MTTRLIRRAVAILGAAALLAGGGAAARASGPEARQTPGRAEDAVAKPQTGFLLKTLRREGRDYRYVVYLPPDYDGSKPYPMILFLHGAGECGRDGWKQVAVGLGPALMLASEKWPFVAVIPQKPEVRERWEDHDALLMAMLDRAKKDYKLDETRFYLTGLSQGGRGTWALGAKHPDLWAAIAPVCGWADAETAPALKSLPIWAFHGDMDTAVPLKASEDIVKAVKEAGGEPKLTVYPGVGHNSWDKAYRDEKLYEWFLSHTRPKK